MFVEEAGYQKVSERDKATPLQAMFSEYRSFCMDSGFRAVSSRTFRERLESLGFECPKVNIGKIVYARRLA